MQRHPLDPIALVGGLLTVIGGVIALLHQSGAISLGPAATTSIALVAVGVAAAALVVLTQRQRSRPD